MKKRTVVLSRKRDIPILQFLWRWKMASTSAIAHRFWSGRKLSTAYRRLWDMKRAHFITTKSVDQSGSNKVWTLDQRGFDVVKNHLPRLKEIGYKSEHLYHDLICNAAHLGNYLYKAPENVYMVTEQQLRRYHPDYLPQWLPNPEEHRPDGYWKIKEQDGERVIALEVELDRKRTLSFKRTLEFYNNYHSINSVLWIVPNFAVAGRIGERAEELSAKRAPIHNFVLIKDFLKLGWQAQIKIGRFKGKTIFSLLAPKGHKIPTKTPHTSVGRLILDTTLVYRNQRRNAHEQS